MCLTVELMLILNTAQVEMKLTTATLSLPIKSRSGLMITPPPRPTNAPINVAKMIIIPYNTVVNFPHLKINLSTYYILT